MRNGAWCSGACGSTGACWAYIAAYGDQFLNGNYPEADRWRIYLVTATVSAVIICGFLARSRLTYFTALAGAVAVWVLSAAILRGGLVLPAIDEDLWGGLLLTLTIAATAMTASLVLGIPLAFMRMSRLPVLNSIARLYIEWDGPTNTVNEPSSMLRLSPPMASKLP